ncbi:kinase/pyrophosphorylase [Pelagibacteraceae bacterium]|nr:kinase/pyrophosphorylase [Pelagibacteraceae bacterium]
MGHKYQINLVSDSTGETLDRLFPNLKSQFSNFDYEKKEHVFVRTESQIDKIIKEIESSKTLFKKYNWPVIDVKKKSVEETAASVIRIFDIKKRKRK